MNSFKIIILIICLSCSSFIVAQDGLDNPITKAMMNVYQQQLNEDPQDYETYFKRANEYYNHNLYPKALGDINNALKYIPNEETDMKFQALCMRASIYEVTGSYEKALDDLKEALTIDPNSYTVLYRKANTEYLLKNYDNAKSDYIRLLRLNNRSVESYIGLSRIAVIEKNLGLANEYADKAVAIAPSQSEVYVRRASVRKMMNNNIGAVEDLILAISTDKDNSRALYEIVEMGNIDYPAVMTGLSNAIRQAPKVGMFYYIRGVIASAHFNYVSALNDFQKIISENLYNYHGIYYEIANCQYALGLYEDAIYNINYAINGASDNSKYYVLKAQILRAQNRSKEGIECCNISLAKNPNLNSAIVTKGLCLSDCKDYDQAVVLYGEATLNEANNPYYYMLRAEIIANHLNKIVEAKSIYERILDLQYDNTDIKSLKGFALLALDRYDEAVEWIENILKSVSDNDGLINYYGACFYAQAGDSDKAFECMNSSLQKGYANYFQWTKNNDIEINVDPIRDDQRFNEIITKYSLIFK